jgi:hypothetical protein
LTLGSDLAGNFIFLFFNHTILFFYYSDWPD